jgi:hypothetical protein
MQQTILAYVATLAGVFGYNEAANFERRHAKRPWGASPWVWGALCLLFGPAAAVLLLVAERKTAVRVTRSLMSRSAPQPQWTPQQPRVPVPQQPRVAPPQRSVARSQQPTSRSQPRWTPRPQQHPSDAHKMYLFGVPESQQQCSGPASGGWSSPQYAAGPAGNVGGTDLLPRRDLSHRSRS